MWLFLPFFKIPVYSSNILVYSNILVLQNFLQNVDIPALSISQYLVSYC